MQPSHKPSKLCGGRNRVMMLVGAVFCVGILLIIVNIYQLRVMTATHLAYHGSGAPEGSLDRWDMVKRPTVWVAGKRVRAVC